MIEPDPSERGVSNEEFSEMINTVKRVMRHQKIRQRHQTMLLAPFVGSPTDCVIPSALRALKFRVFDGALVGPPETWLSQLQQSNAVVGWTALARFNELLERYPLASVILPAEPVETCLEGMVPLFHEHRASVLSKSPTAVQLFDEFFEGQFDIAAVSLSVMRARLNDILAHVPHSQLLLFRRTDGWPELCRFLQKRAPKKPFPSPIPRAPAASSLSWLIIPPILLFIICFVAFFSLHLS